MPTKLREERANLWEQMKQLLAETEERGMTAEESAKHTQMETELRRLTSDIEARDRAEELEKRLAAPQPLPDGAIPPSPEVAGQADKDRRYRAAFNAYLQRGMNGISAGQRDALVDGLVPLEARALGVGTGAGGGYTVPQEFLAEIVKRMKAYGAVQRVARVVTTESGADMPFPTLDDTANVGRLLAENTQLTQTDVAFGTKTLKSYVYSSDLILVSLQLLMDTAFDVEQDLRDALAERIGRIMNQHFTTGTGSSQPQGLVTGGTVGVTGATGTTLTFGADSGVVYDNLISLVHSVDPAYRSSGRCRWMLGDTALSAVRRVKNTQNIPLWQPSMQDGVPDNLLGYPVEINPDMPVPAANAKTIAFGDFFAGYLIRMVRDIQMIRLDERYADFLQVGFFGFARADGMVRDANAYKLFAHSAT